MSGGASARPGSLGCHSTLWDWGETPFCALAGSGRWRSAVGVGTRKCCPVLRRAPRLQARPKNVGRTPFSRSWGPSSAPAGPGRPTGEEAGGGDGQLDRKWAGPASPRRPSPCPGPSGWRRGWGRPGPSLPLRPSGTPALAPHFPARPSAGLSGGRGILYWGQPRRGRHNRGSTDSGRGRPHQDKYSTQETWVHKHTTQVPIRPRAEAHARARPHKCTQPDAASLGPTLPPQTHNAAAAVSDRTVPCRPANTPGAMMHTCAHTGA